MKAYSAWLSAKDGQMIYRVSKPLCSFTKGLDCMIHLESVLDIDFSGDDWEIVKEKKSFTLENVDFSGMVGYETITSIFREKGLAKPNLFTKIYFEWEA